MNRPDAHPTKAGPGAGALPWALPRDDRGARAIWSRLTEPGDGAAGRYVARLGAAPALAALVEGRAPDEQSARWRVRLPHTRPERDLAVLSGLGGRLVIPADPEWPSGLDDLGDRRPFCLWVVGPLALTPCTDRSVAIVGARAATRYGEQIALGLGAGVAERGICVVSGAALGIDGCAHRGALTVKGPTLAVLACGIDRVYPRGHERLLEQIASEGGLVSEVPPGTEPSRWRFLQRNRLIAAMTQGTVVVEAAWRSGAAATANAATDLGRYVAAVPGPVTSAASAGCHRLLRAGAACVTDAAEVIELISSVGDGLADPRARGPVADHDGLDPDGIRVLDAVPLRGARSAPEIAVGAGLDLIAVRACLARLELRGLVDGDDSGWRRTRVRRTRGGIRPCGAGT